MELFQTLPVVTFWTRNMETSRCNGAAILSRRWDISSSGLAAAILKKTDFRLHRAVFTIVPLSCWTPKIGG